jgi:hypothetical protein
VTGALNNPEDLIDCRSAGGGACGFKPPLRIRVLVVRSGSDRHAMRRVRRRSAT